MEPGAFVTVKRIASQAAAAVGFLTVLLGLLASFVGVWWDFHPESRPDPRQTVSAELAFYTTETRVALDDYLRRVAMDGKHYVPLRASYLTSAGLDPGRPREPGQRSYLRSRGTVFYIRADIQGFKGRELDLRWSIYRAGTRRRVPDAGLQNQRAGSILDLEAPTTRQIAQLWVTDLPGRGPYFMRLELFDGRTSLAVADSAPFPGVV
jgi:hypothetical protein